MKVSLFLGAGASTNYWMPTTCELKEELAKEHAKGTGKTGGAAGDGEPDVWSCLLSDSNSLDIEHVLLLADTVDRLNKTEGGRELVRNSGRLGRQLEEVMRVGKVARQRVFEKYAWDHNLDEYARELLGPLVDMAMGMNGNKQVAVFTTNYDRAVEEFCEGGGLRVCDGFSLNDKTGRRIWSGKFGDGKDGGSAGGAPGVVRLYKLHGSLDWKRSDKHGVLRVDYDGYSTSTHYRDVLIPPSLADKEGDVGNEPYKTIHDSFKKELESSDACVVVGFSFRDPYIAGEFRRFAERDDKTLIVVGPNAFEDVHKYILEKLSGGSGATETDMPVMVGITTKDGKSRKAVVIVNKWTSSTAKEIVIRAQSVAEGEHDLPVHTLGSCTKCKKKMIIDDMEKHIMERHNRNGREASMLRIAEGLVGAPWMLALARPGAVLGDLGKFIQSEWMERYCPDVQHRDVRFAPKLHSGDMDAGTALSDVPWANVLAWYSNTGRLRVAIAGSMNVRELREPVEVLAVGEEPPPL